jgi:FAD/FMN-containing dehydrogenase
MTVAVARALLTVALIGVVCATVAIPVIGHLRVPCGAVYSASDAQFQNLTRVDNARVQRVPALVVAATCEGDVVASVKWARANGATLSALAGGHSAEGFGVAVDNGLVVNVRGLRTWSLDTGSRQLTVGAGFRFRELYSRLKAIDPTLLLVGGGCPDVGISGFMLGGGYSFLSRVFGMGSDSVLGLRIVLANGTVAALTPDSELFRAVLAGGGGNFGIVTQFTVQLHTAFTAVQSVCLEAGNNVAQLSQLFPLYSRWIVDDATPNNVGLPALLANINGTMRFCVNVFGTDAGSWRGAADAAAFAVASLLLAVQSEISGSWTNVIIETRNLTFYDAEMTMTDTQLDGRFGLMTSFVLQDGELDDQRFAAAFFAAVANAPSGGTVANVHDMGGRLRAVPRPPSWFPHRDANSVVQLKVLWPHTTPAGDAKHEAWARATTISLRQLQQEPRPAYVNYIESNLTLPDWPLAYFGDALPLLQRVKQRVDPDQFFDFAQAISPPTTCSYDAPTMRNLAMAFQFAQIHMDARGAASLFAPNGSTVIPVGHGGGNRATGQQTIAHNFATYFATLAVLNETILSPLVVSGTVVAFSKRIDTLPKNSTTPHTVFVINWFNMTCDPASGELAINEFDAAFAS